MVVVDSMRRRRRYRGRALLHLLVLGVLGCSGFNQETGGRRTSIPTGPHRTSFAHWTVLESVAAGVRVEYPEKAFNPRASYLGFTFSLHPTYPPRGVYSDAFKLITVVIRRFSEQRWEEWRANIAGSQAVARDRGDEESSEYWRWYMTWHDKPEIREEAMWAVYRRDLKCADKSVVWMKASFKSGSRDAGAEYLEDRQAVLRVLKSVECLEGWVPPAD